MPVHLDITTIELSDAVHRLERKVSDLEKHMRGHGLTHRARGGDPIALGWRRWTPALTAVTTNPNLGSTGVAFGRTWQGLGVAIAHFYFEFGGSGVSNGSGGYRVTLPFTLHPSWVHRLAYGFGLLEDDSAGAQMGHIMRSAAGNFTEGLMLRTDTGGQVSATIPWTWATGDRISGTLMFQHQGT